MVTRFKPGVICPSALVEHVMGPGEVLVRIYDVMKVVWERMVPDRDLEITSVCDGKHMPTSKHYKAGAIDFSALGLGPVGRADVCKALRLALGGNYDVVDEVTHIHIEHDPKGLKTA